MKSVSGYEEPTLSSIWAPQLQQTHTLPGRCVLDFISVKSVSELHGSWTDLDAWKAGSCIFSFTPEFMAETQNPSVSDNKFQESTILSLSDFVGNWDEILLYPIIGSLSQ